MNQTTGNLQAEAQQPQNQKRSDNRPKHIDSYGYPCCASFLSRETALSDFPHSRQTRLARGVISPQNGQILCDRTSWTRGLNIANKVPRNCRADASRRRRDGRYGSIISPFAGLCAPCANLRPLNNDRARPTILCRIAHIVPHSLVSHCQGSNLRRLRTEQFRPAIRSCCAHHDFLRRAFSQKAEI